MQTETLEKLIDDLAALDSDDETFNQYEANDNPNNAIRRGNLQRYLQAMHERDAKTLMVMEAPGYRGCRLTGIPVTSRRVLLDGVPELDLLGDERGYQDVADEGFDDVQGEQSATIVWELLASLGRAPLLWNTFPLHPHEAGDLRSNRRPRKPETSLGGDFLRTVLMLYKPEVIIAVGNVAHVTMTGMGINSVKVRHPAQGGKADFVKGMTALLT